jgi:hypothetical protein
LYYKVGRPKGFNPNQKDLVLLLDRDEQMPFHWSCLKEPATQHVVFATSANASEREWSPLVNISKISYFQMVLPHTQGRVVLTVNVRVHDGRYFVQLFNETFFHHQISNDTDYAFFAIECDEGGNVVEDAEPIKVDAKQQYIPFFSKTPQAAKKFVQLSTKRVETRGTRDTRGSRQDLAPDAAKCPAHVDIRVDMDLIKDYGHISSHSKAPHVALQILKNKNVGLTKLLKIGYTKVNVNAQNYSMLVSLMEGYSQSINISLREIGVSCLDYVPKALVYLYFQDTEVLATIRPSETTVEISLGTIISIFVLLNLLSGFFFLYSLTIRLSPGGQLSAMHSAPCGDLRRQQARDWPV